MADLSDYCHDSSRLSCSLCHLSAILMISIQSIIVFLLFFGTITWVILKKWHPALQKRKNHGCGCDKCG
jgi:hypothetical protein